MKEEEKKGLAKTGMVSGGIITGLGAGLYGLGKKVEKDLSKEVPGRLAKGARRSAEKFGKESAEKMVKGWKTTGGIATVAGAPILAVSAYKHYKYKKKKDDDHTEK